jgi:WD40 repeat protein
MRKTLAFAAVLEISRESVSVGVVTTENQIYHVTNFDGSQLLMCGKLPSSEKIFGGFKHGFVAVERKSCLAHFYHSMNVTTKPLNSADVEFIATSGSWVAISSRNGQVIGWNMKQRVVRQIVTITSGYISCLALSRPFGVVAAGTEDGTVIVSMMCDGSFLWSAGLDAMPKNVVITEGWGFVFVQTAATLHLFTVNGKQLKTKKVEMDIDFITTWKCEKGFDYIALADRKGSVQLFETLHMQDEGCRVEVQARILAMAYKWAARSLIIVTENGEMLSISQRLP